MNKIISANQLNDAKSLFDAAAARFDMPRIVSEDDNVPRPTLQNLIDTAARKGVLLPINNLGSLVLGPNDSIITAEHPGLRGVPHYRAGRMQRTAPAIVLRDGGHVGLLLSDAMPSESSELKQKLLENLYTTQRVDIATHGSGGRVAPALGGHALVAASFAGKPEIAHDQVHYLAQGNFGANFDRAGNRDIFFGAGRHDVLQVRSAVLGLGQVILEVTRAYQMHEGDGLFGNGMTAEQLNIALTVAATLSSTEKRRSFDPAGTMEAMTK